MTEPKNSDLMLAIGNLQGTIRGIDDKLDDHKDRMNSHSKRIGTVERHQAWWAGAAASVGAIAGILAKKMGLN